MTHWTRLSPEPCDRQAILIARWADPDWLILRAGRQENGKIYVDERVGAIGLSAAELANIPQPPQQPADAVGAE